MPWDPQIYNRFKSKREEPFFDLISHVTARPGMQILDLGCGTGALTSVLADRFPESEVLGIDNSAEMLAKAPEGSNLKFVLRSIADQLARNDKFDLITANASLQWIGDHASLFKKIIGRLVPGGQLAVQMPSQSENKLNQILYQLVQEPPFYELLRENIRHSPVLTLDEYTGLLFQNGAKDAVVYQKVYPIIAQSTETLFDFISGSALVPYMERLPEEMQQQLSTAFRMRIGEHFNVAPMVYSFKRIILVALF